MCLENAFCKMCVTVCGKFVPDEGVVAGYDNRIRDKSPAKWGVQIAGMIFQTRSRVAYKTHAKYPYCEPVLLQSKGRTWYLHFSEELEVEAENVEKPKIYFSGKVYCREKTDMITAFFWRIRGIGWQMIVHVATESEVWTCTVLTKWVGLRVMTIRVSTLKNGEVRLRVMTIRHSTLLVSWYEGVYHKVSVEAK